MKNSRRRRKKRIVMRQTKMFAISGAILMFALFIFGVSYLWVRRQVNQVAAGTIGSNIYIETVNVSGMKAQEAKAALKVKEEQYRSQALVLKVEQEELDLVIGDLGFAIKDIDKLVKDAAKYGKEGSVWRRYREMKAMEETKKQFDVSYTVDVETVKTVLTDKVLPIEKRATNATIKRQDGKFVITEETIGKTIDVEASVESIETYFQKYWKRGNAEIAMVSKVDRPTVTKADLETIGDVLGTFKTYCSGNSGRLLNIKTGSGHMNGVVLMPGEEVSVHAKTAPYKAENGYAMAGSYENGQVVESMGGGICQVSTTLYNAVLLAELEVTQRSPHSMIVGYVKPSMDAAIAGTWKDLKFKNNQETPIYIEAVMSGRNLTFTIYGKETRDANRKIEYVSETTETIPCTVKFVVSDAELGVKKTTVSGHVGKKAKLWKVVYENGIEVSRKQVNQSNYEMSGKTVSVGIATDNAEAKKIVQDAVKTQKEATINAAIAQAKALIAQTNAPTSAPMTPAPTSGN